MSFFEAVRVIPFTQRRATAMLLDATLPFDAAVVREEATPILLRLTGTDLEGDATVTVFGSLLGVDQVETVTVSPDVPTLTEALWTAIAHLTSEDEFDGTLRVEAVRASGEPAIAPHAVGILYGALRRKSARLVLAGQGVVEQERVRLITGPDESLLPKDTLEGLGVTYEVENVFPLYAGATLHHYEAELHRVS